MITNFGLVTICFLLVPDFSILQISMKYKVILSIYKKLSSPNVLVNCHHGYVALEWLIVLNHVNVVLLKINTFAKN